MGETVRGYRECKGCGGTFPLSYFPAGPKGKRIKRCEDCQWFDQILWKGECVKGKQSCGSWYDVLRHKPGEIRLIGAILLDGIDAVREGEPRIRVWRDGRKHNRDLWAWERWAGACEWVDRLTDDSPGSLNWCCQMLTAHGIEVRASAIRRMLGQGRGLERPK